MVPGGRAPADGAPQKWGSAVLWTLFRLLRGWKPQYSRSLPQAILLRPLLQEGNTARISFNFGVLDDFAYHGKMLDQHAQPYISSLW